MLELYNKYGTVNIERREESRKNEIIKVELSSANKKNKTREIILCYNVEQELL